MEEFERRSCCISKSIQLILNEEEEEEEKRMQPAPYGLYEHCSVEHSARIVL